MFNKVTEEELKSYLAQAGDIEFALIFGSCALGRVSPISDIDVAIYFSDGHDAVQLADRQIDITCAIMSICKISRVDVVILNLANPFLKFQVIKYGRLLYAKDEKTFYRFKAISLGMYQDIKPMYDLYEHLAEISLRRGLHG